MKAMHAATVSFFHYPKYIAYIYDNIVNVVRLTWQCDLLVLPDFHN